LISTAGFGFFLYGKKQQRIPQLAVGLLLMIYPYFVSNLLFMSLIAVALVALLWIAVRAGL
jgi:hypothetical protein